MCLEAHYIFMVKHELQHTTLVSFNVGNHKSLFCHAMIVCI